MRFLLLRCALLTAVLSGAWLSAAEGFDARFAEIRDQASARELYAFLRAVPKGGDLHHHGLLGALAEEILEAATDTQLLRGNAFYTRVRDGGCGGQDYLRFRNIQRSTWSKLSECEQADYAPLKDLTPTLRSAWLSSLKLDRPGEGRDEFFERIVPRLGEIIRNPYVSAELLARMAKRYRGEGLVYLETQFRTNNMLDAEGQLMDAEAALAIVRERLGRPDVREGGVAVRFLYTLIRFAPDAEAQAERAFAWVAGHRDWWVGVNMAGREDNDKGNALRLLPVFRKLRRQYADVPLTLHGGELDRSGPEVRNTLLLGARRIGHGLNLVTDPDGMLLLRTGIAMIEINLVSNQLLEYFPDLREHPFPEYLRTGVPVALSTDDPGAWDSNIVDEYFFATRTFRLTWSEVVALGRTSLERSFAEPELRARLLAEYEGRVKRFEQEWGSGDWRTRLAGMELRASGYAGRRILAQ